MPKQVSLKAYYLQQQALFQPAMDAAPPDYKDVDNVTDQQIEDYFTNYFTAKDHKDQIHRKIAEALSALTDEQLKQVYQKIKGDKADKRGTEADFINVVRKRSTENILNTARYGGSLETMLDAYQEAIGPEKTAEIVKAPIQPYLLSPEYKDAKDFNPYEKEIRELRDKYTKTDDPVKNQEAEKLLARVEVSLRRAKPEILSVYNTIRTTERIRNYPNYDDLIGRRVDIIQQQGLQSLGNGAFKDVVKPSVMEGLYEFSFLEEKQYPVPMTEEQEKKLNELSQNKDIGLSQDTREALREVGLYMDQLDYDETVGTPLSGQVFPSHRPKNENERFFEGEQGIKYYAFWPLYSAKVRLIRAVQEGDIDSIREAQEKYEKTEETLDRAFAVLKSDKLYSGPLFPPNVESTRESSGLLPEKFALDTTRQKKLNAVFAAYAQMKSAGLTLEALANDPAGTARKICLSYVQAGGLDSRQGNIGAALQNGMKGSYNDRSADTMLQSAYVNFEGAMLRGLSGIIGLEKDPERRKQFMAAFQLGMRSAYPEVSKEIKRYELMSKICTSESSPYTNMRAAIYQNAALRPEEGDERFDLGKMTDNFLRSDQKAGPLDPAKPGRPRDSWQDDMDAARNFADGSRQYNWKELAGRNKKLIGDAAREQLITGSYKNEFNPNEYLLHAFSAQSRLLKNAEARHGNDPDFKVFKESVKNTYELASDPDTKAVLKMGAALMEDANAYGFLETGKGDQLVTSDSAEYTKMKESLGKVRKIRDILAEGDPKKMSELYKTSIAESLQAAKENAFNYVRLKTKNGTKRRFHYRSGEQRAQEGFDNYRKLSTLQDELGLRSPAQKAYEDARETLLRKRGDSQWLMGEDGRTALATMLYARTFIDAKIPAADQKKAFAPETLQKTISGIREKALSVYRNYADVITLADGALENKGTFKEIAARGAANRLKQYKEDMAVPRLNRARKDCVRGFALDLAAKQLGIKYQIQTWDERNPAIVRKADQIMKDPAFREVMKRLMEGKDIKALRELHKPAQLDLSGETKIAFGEYALAKASVKYEKCCAAVTAEAMLRQNNNNQEASPEAIQKMADNLRRDKRFRSFIRQKEAAFKREADYMNAAKELDVPEKRGAFLEEMAGKVKAPIPQVKEPKRADPVRQDEGAAPQAGQA